MFNKEDRVPHEILDKVLLSAFSFTNKIDYKIRSKIEINVDRVVNIYFLNELYKKLENYANVQ